jgi:hypothetical protein
MEIVLRLSNRAQRGVRGFPSFRKERERMGHGAFVVNPAEDYADGLGQRASTVIPMPPRGRKTPRIPGNLDIFLQEAKNCSKFSNKKHVLLLQPTHGAFWPFPGLFLCGSIDIHVAAKATSGISPVENESRSCISPNRQRESCC